MRDRLVRARFQAKVVAKRRLFATGRFLIAMLHGFPKSVTMHAGQEMPMHRIPVRSTKADAKRAQLANIRQMTGNSALSWKSARKIANALERDQRAKDREQERIATIAAQFRPTDHVAVIPPAQEQHRPWVRRIFQRIFRRAA